MSRLRIRHRVHRVAVDDRAEEQVRDVDDPGEAGDSDLRVGVNHTPASGGRRRDPIGVAVVPRTPARRTRIGARPGRGV